VNRKTMMGLIAALAVVLSVPVQAGDLKNAYVDGAGRVHIVTSAGRDVPLTGSGKAANPKLAAKSLKQLESFQQADVPVEKRPDCSSSSDRYKPD
jgi:hypothetical protein